MKGCEREGENEGGELRGCISMDNKGIQLVSTRLVLFIRQDFWQEVFHKTVTNNGIRSQIIKISTRQRSSKHWSAHCSNKGTHLHGSGKPVHDMITP